MGGGHREREKHLSEREMSMVASRMHPDRELDPGPFV